MDRLKSYQDLQAELEELRIQLQEANDTIDAIRHGEVDALVVKNGHEHQLYTLKSADQTYRVFIEKMKEGAVTLNREGLILYSNTQFASMVGVPLRRVIGLSFLHFVPEESKGLFSFLFELGWESDSKGELLLRNKEGHCIPFLISFTSLNLDEGQALSVILTDLSSQKETEKQLKQKNRQLEEAKKDIIRINEHLEELVNERTQELLISREYFKFLADNIPVMVWTADADGNLDYANRKWLEFTGLQVTDAHEKRIALIHPDDRELVQGSWSKALENMMTFDMEFRYKRSADGQYRWQYAKAIPFRNEKGEVSSWIGTTIDIHDQKEELEKKDEFISVASHELRTPLTSLKGYLQIINSQDLPDDIRLFISRGNNSINKLQSLINQLLDASRIKAGKLEFDKQQLELDKLVQNCCEASRFMYPDYQFEEEVDPGLIVEGNEERLEQVIMNLVSNAVKYSPFNKKILLCAKKDGNHACVTVIDKGHGIAISDQQFIFDRFYRTEDTKMLTSGLGMGLYISNEIIKEHGSSIVVKSKINEGSSFSFRLPLVTP